MIESCATSGSERGEESRVDRRERKTESAMFSFLSTSHPDRSTYRSVDGVVLCEGNAGSEEGGEDGSEKHCVLFIGLVVGR